jgi:hypothetical protein
MSADWPFSDPPNVATMVSRYILEGEPIIFAYRDWEDGMWLFLPNRVTEASHGRLVALQEVYQLDPSIAELVDLPAGWKAHRASPESPWERQKNHPFPIFAERGFYLEDATEYARQRPDLYEIPPEAFRTDLQIGDMAKLIFRFADEESARTDNDSERMWVEVVEVDKENARYRGTLANEPQAHSEIAYGDELWFHAIHVFDIEEDD